MPKTKPDDEKQDESTLEAGAESEESKAESSEEQPSGGDDPIAALRAELVAEREARLRLEGRLAERERASGEEAAPEKTYTRAELQRAVDEGRISEDQRDDILDTQRARQLKAELREEIRAEEAQRRIQDEIDRYSREVPGITQGSTHANRRLLEQEYQQLVASGLPDGPGTQLAALRSAFGRLGTAVRETTRQSRERHEEAGSGGGGPAGGGGNAWQKGLPQKQIRYLQNQLDKGLYSGTDDPAFQRYVAIARGADPRKAGREQAGERRVQ